MVNLFHMDGFGVYIWAGYGIAALAMIILAIRSRAKFRELSQEAERLKASRKERT